MMNGVIYLSIILIHKLDLNKSQNSPKCISLNYSKLTCLILVMDGSNTKFDILLGSYSGGILRQVFYKENIHQLENISRILKVCTNRHFQVWRKIYYSLKREINGITMQQE